MMVSKNEKELEPLTQTLAQSAGAVEYPQCFRL